MPKTCPRPSPPALRTAKNLSRDKKNTRRKLFMHVNELQIEKHVKHILEKENKQKNDTNTFLLTFKFITKQKQISPLPRPLNMGRFHQLGWVCKCEK